MCKIKIIVSTYKLLNLYIDINSKISFQHKKYTKSLIDSHISFIITCQD